MTGHLKCWTKIIQKFKTQLSPLFSQRWQRTLRKSRITTTITNVAETIKPIVFVWETTEILCDKYHSVRLIEIPFNTTWYSALHVRSYPDKASLRTVDFHDPPSAYYSFHHIFPGDYHSVVPRYQHLDHTWHYMATILSSCHSYHRLKVKAIEQIELFCIKRTWFSAGFLLYQH